MRLCYTEQEIREALRYVKNELGYEALQQLCPPTTPQNPFRVNTIVDLAFQLHVLEGVPGRNIVLSNLKNGLKNPHVFLHAYFQLKLAGFLKSKLGCKIGLENDNTRTDIRIEHENETIHIHCKTTQLMETKEAKEVAQIQHEIWDQFFDLEISQQQNVQVTVTLHKRSWSEEDIQTLIKEIKNLKIRTPYQRTFGGESAIIEVKESPLQSNAPLGAALGVGPAIIEEIDTGNSYPIWFGGNGFAQLVIYGPPVSMSKHLLNQMQRTNQQAIMNAANIMALDPWLIWSPRADLRELLKRELRCFPNLSGILFFSYQWGLCKKEPIVEYIPNPKATCQVDHTFYGLISKTSIF
jgi:hypothetical protein